jgi:hypothetical protein
MRSPIRTVHPLCRYHSLTGFYLSGTRSLFMSLMGSSRARSTGMTVFLSQILIPIALASVAAVLLLGLVNMMRGGDPWRSQYLMRTRVLLQFVAIVLVMLAIWFMAGR